MREKGNSDSMIQSGMIMVVARVYALFFCKSGLRHLTIPRVLLMRPGHMTQLSLKSIQGVCDDAHMFPVKSSKHCYSLQIPHDGCVAVISPLYPQRT